MQSMGCVYFLIKHVCVNMCSDFREWLLGLAGWVNLDKVYHCLQPAVQLARLAGAHAGLGGLVYVAHVRGRILAPLGAAHCNR